MINTLKNYGLDNKWHLLSLLFLPVLILMKNPALALLVAMAGSLLAGNRLPNWANELSNYALQFAIVILGFTLNMQDLWTISRDYSLLVSFYVIATLSFGLGVGYLLKVNHVTRTLTASGTAICGGTTVASLSPILRANVDQTGVVMAMIFLLNAIAMFIYPTIGHWLGLSESVFGLWAALSIHDTSSVVATAAIYGEEALRVATTVKLGRTLWLIPLLVLFSMITKQDSTRLRLPLFVVFFIAASILGSLVQSFVQLDSLFTGLSWLSKGILVVALFFIGSQIDFATLKQMRGKALIHAVGLWLFVAPVSLFFIFKFS